MNRYYGHFEGDAQTYRGANEVKQLRTEHDCLTRFSLRAIGTERVTESQLANIDREVSELIEDAVAQAKASPPPAAEELLTDVYVAY